MVVSVINKSISYTGKSVDEQDADLMASMFIYEIHDQNCLIVGVLNKTYGLCEYIAFQFI